MTTKFLVAQESIEKVCWYWHGLDTARMYLASTDASSHTTVRAPYSQQVI